MINDYLALKFVNLSREKRSGTPFFFFLNFNILYKMHILYKSIIVIIELQLIHTCTFSRADMNVGMPSTNGDTG